MILEIEFKFWDGFVKKLERFFNLRCRAGNATCRAQTAVKSGETKVAKIIEMAKPWLMEVFKKIQKVGFFTFFAVLKI